MREETPGTLQLPRFLHARFSDRVEERVSLRLIVLAMGWWVAFAMGWVGAPPWIWVGGGILLTAGHVVSWRLRASRSIIKTGLVAVAILGTTPLVPGSVTDIVEGDWLPATYLLLLFLGIASFELRSRGGLYTSIGLTGVILFLVAQRALDVTFGVLLMGYTTLLLSFLATSFIVDQAGNAEIRWFRNRLSFAGFWTAVFVAVLLVSVPIFLLLPKDLVEPLRGSQLAALPLRGSGEPGPLGPRPVASALPVTPSDGASPQDGGETVAASEEVSPTGEGSDDRAHVAGSGPLSGGGIGPAPSPVQAFDTTGLTSPMGASAATTGHDGVVMQVRSPVLTYWRGQVFDLLDDAGWRPDPRGGHGFTATSGQSLRAPVTSEAEGLLRYVQTFFIRTDFPAGTVFAGYAPVTASAPIDGNGEADLSEGTVYRVTSVLPDFRGGRYTATERAYRYAYEYLQIPGDREALRSLARSITGDAESGRARGQRIVNYLHASLEFDEEATDQLVLTSSPARFLAGEAPGTSMDFATSAVLLARAAGIPARLATGYLPGRLDPLSGTYVVRARDAHAWAELGFPGEGWVPFDGAPRIEAVELRGGIGGTGMLHRLFGTSYAGSVFDSVSSSPGRVGDLLARLLDVPVAALVAPAATAILLFAGAVIARRLSPSLRTRGGASPYSDLPGEDRTEMLRAFRAAERALRRKGVEPRVPSETVTQYLDRVRALGGEAEFLRRPVWSAAYDPRPYDGPTPRAVRAQVRAMERALRRRPAALAAPTTA